jgi:flavodoxin I
MKKIAIVYSFNTLKTGKIAKRIKEAFGKNANVELVNVEEVTADEFLQYDNLICGTATWFDGELPNHWDEFLPELEDMDLKGKRVALFGLGDQKGYPENFLDGMGILGEIMEYSYESSRAERGDQFIGLGIDFETQGTKNKDRVNGWVQKLMLELK